MVKYCSESCQKSHLTEHKTRCNRYPPQQPVLDKQPPPQRLLAVLPPAATSPEKSRQLPESSQPDPDPVMTDSDVSKQIQPKANEISVSAEEDFNIEKPQLVEVEKKKKTSQEYERKEKQVQGRKKIECSMQLNASRINVLQAHVELSNSMKDNASKELLSDSSHVSDVASMNHRSTSLDADARLIPPRNDTPCLSILGRVDKIPVIALNYHVHKGPPLVIFDGDEEGRRSTIRCAFDPGGDTSPKLLFSTLFVASWFPP